MKDTSPEMEQTYRRMLLATSGARRMFMACDMFETARAMMRASLDADAIERDSVTWKMALLRRTYGATLDAGIYLAVERRLRNM